MQILRVFMALLIALNQAIIFVPTANAGSSGGIVIAQMYPGATGTATQEFIELYNNTVSAVDVTNWCISYVSSSGATTTKLACMVAPDSSTRLWLPPNGHARFVSNEYRAAASVSADGFFAGGMASTGGHVKLLNAASGEVDKLGWGTATSPETTAVAAPTNGNSLQRKTIVGGLQDTDHNFNDFMQATPVLHASDIYEVVTLIDVCPNISGTQSTMPAGYLADETGSCQVDSCLNLGGLQVSVPDGYDVDANGVCSQHDECINLSGAQNSVPGGMEKDGSGNCIITHSALELSEILPNAIGSDTGNEFVEVYNSGETAIDLTFYYLQIGTVGDVYSFPAGTILAPGEYKTFSDRDMKFTLVNSSSRVVLSAVGGTTFGDSGVYENPKENESWALIGTIWQYTNRPTPGAANLPSIVEKGSTESGGLSPCPAGKYRNPLTNRCRNIVSNAVVLADCGYGKYRNPETNRCKSISSGSGLAPCKAGQYRNPETNRCRNIVTTASATLKPCKENQYRSEETNRCRTIPAASIPDAAYKVQPVKDSSSTFVGWWVLGIVGLAASGYGLWEWRNEVFTYLQKAARRFHKT